MKRLAWIALVPLIAFAGARDDYAQQWPLSLTDADAGAYRVTLDRSVYAQLQSPLLTDIDVVNADGTAVASSLFDAEQPLAKAPTSVEVPWFPLPVGSSPESRDIASISEIATDGSLRRVVMSNAPTPGDASSNEYLIDTSRLQFPVRALEFRWAGDQAPFDSAYRVTASDDLKNWRTVQDEGHLVDLQNNAQRVLNFRIALDDTKARYLRLIPLQKNQRTLSLTSVRAELAEGNAAQNWSWEDLKGKQVTEKDGTHAYVYEIEGRFPFERADVELPGNSSNEWTLTSRDSKEAEWQFAASPWMAFQLQGRDGGSRSPPQAFNQLNRSHYWRLVSKTSNDDGVVPVLKLGYRPEVMVFLAQGKAPYALLAGSARARRADAPLAQLVDALRAQRGQSWQPAQANLGAMQSLAGKQAMTPAPEQRDWKSWLLWVMLIGGALIVVSFAFSLLKKPPASSS